jgi:hypothetical protein
MPDIKAILRDPTKWPIIANVLLLAWTAIVSGYTTYGDFWASSTALALICAPIPLHLLILFKKRWKLTYLYYAVAHIAFTFWLGIVCLTFISKDSL